MASALPKSEPKGEKRINSVVQAVEEVDVTNTSAWNDLDALSTHTYIDGIEVDPDGVVLDSGEKFHGVVNIYVLLQYGTNADEQFETSESFLGRFIGHFDKVGKAIVDDVTVDTSPFYEGEEVVTE